jgi:hypothetical protein
MFKYRRNASVLIGGGLLALTSVVALGGPAQAQRAGVILVPVNFSASAAWVLPLSFKAGDCHQVGQNEQNSNIPSFLVIDKSATTPNLYTITWRGTLYTDFTTNQDVWHQSFVFRSADGPITTVNFDGPPMGVNGAFGAIYYTNQSRALPLTSDQANKIRFVDWIGDC